MNASWMAADDADEPVSRTSTVRGDSRGTFGHRSRHAVSGRVTLFVGWPAGRKAMA